MNYELGQLLKEYRIRKNFSTVQAAELINIKARTYGDIENGYRDLKLDELVILSREFDFDLNLFFNRSGHTVVTHGENSPASGSGDVINMDRELISSFILLVNKLSDRLDNLV